MIPEKYFSKQPLLSVKVGRFQYGSKMVQIGDVIIIMIIIFQKGSLKIFKGTKFLTYHPLLKIVGLKNVSKNYI